MALNYGSDKKHAVQALFDAQKLAFAPIMFQAAKSLRDLGILDALKENKDGLTIDQLVEITNLSTYGVKVLVEAGLSIELVMVKDDVFHLTKTGWYLLTNAMTRANMDFTHDVNYKGMFTLSESIKTGKPTGLEEFGKWDTVYEALSELPKDVQESWFAFDHYYSDTSFPAILPIVFKDGAKTLLDVGGNTGKFSVECAKYDPDVKVTILDLPGQLEKANKYIEENKFEDRISGHPINLLDHTKAFPKGNDIIWMSQFLDCFSQEDVLELLKRGHNAMDENASLYIMETYWDKQKFEASTYALHATSLYFTNIANGCSQMYHSEDMIKLIDKANLYIDETFDDVGVSHTLYKCKIKK
jgi:hypothetical protein